MSLATTGEVKKLFCSDLIYRSVLRHCPAVCRSSRAAAVSAAPFQGLLVPSTPAWLVAPGHCRPQEKLPARITLEGDRQCCEQDGLYYARDCVFEHSVLNGKYLI